MGRKMKQVVQIIKSVDSIKADDFVLPLNGEEKLLRVLRGIVEYDHGDPFAVWLVVEDFKTGKVLPKMVNSAEVTWPLNEMEVLAWASL